MSQQLHRDAMIRKIQVVKMRGQAQSPGVHTFRITDDGIEVFPRAVISPKSTPALQIKGTERLSIGVPEIG